MSLLSSFITRENVLIVRLQGELDHHEAVNLRTIWQNKLRENMIKHVIVNLEDVTFMDSSGIGVLLGRYKEISELGGQLIICCVQPELERIINMAGLNKIIHFVKNEQIALIMLGVAS